MPPGVFSLILLLATSSGSVLSICFCHQLFPTPALIVSVITVLFRSQAICVRHGMAVFVFFVSLKSFSSLLLYVFCLFLFSNCFYRSVTSAKFGRIFTIKSMAQRTDFKKFSDIIGHEMKIDYKFSLFSSTRIR